MSKEREIAEKMIADSEAVIKCSKYNIIAAETNITIAEKKLAELEVTYSIADRFYEGKDKNEKCILILAGGNSEVILSSLVGGGYWGLGRTKVKDVQRISQVEFDSMVEHCTFTRYWDNRKKCKIS